MKYKKVLMFHGRGNTNNDQFSCTSLLAKQLKADGFDVTFDSLNYESGISVDEILAKYPEDYDFVVGHSAGGFLALQYAQSHENIKRLILIAPCTSTKNFTPKFIQSLQDDLSPEEYQMFMDFHDQGIRHIAVNANCEKISFVFGKQDDFITQEVADIYAKTYPNAKYIYLFAGHMGNSPESGAYKIMEIYDRLFPKEFSK